MGQPGMRTNQIHAATRSAARESETDSLSSSESQRMISVVAPKSMHQREREAAHELRLDSGCDRSSKRQPGHDRQREVRDDPDVIVAEELPEHRHGERLGPGPEVGAQKRRRAHLLIRRGIRDPHGRIDEAAGAEEQVEANDSKVERGLGPTKKVQQGVAGADAPATIVTARA